MKPDFEKVAERIVGVDVEDRTHSDNLAIVLCSYFSRHIYRPDGDEDDMDEGGWSPWTIEKYHGAKKLLSSYVYDQLRTAYAAGLERAAEIADEYDGPGLESRNMYDQLGDGNKTRVDIAAAIRAALEAIANHTQSVTHGWAEEVREMARSAFKAR